MDLIQLTRQLIDIPSITNDEHQIALFLKSYLEEEKFVVSFQEVELNRYNLIANYSDDTKIIFCTHLDTVPPHYSSSMKNNFIYGRGACDAKGIIASMIHTAAGLKKKGENKFALLFVVGEETNSAGAKAAASSDIKSDFIVVGEPTENKFASAQKGSLSYTIQTKGVAAHSAYPEKGLSAIDCLLNVLVDLQSTDWGENNNYGRGTMNIGVINGGQSANIIAEYAEAKIFHRLVDECDTRKRQVIDIVNDRASIEFHAQNNPQQLYCIDGFETTIVNFGSDVPYLRRIGKPLLIGPGSIHDAHTEQEKISIRDLVLASEVYERVYFSLLNERDTINEN